MAEVRPRSARRDGHRPVLPVHPVAVRGHRPLVQAGHRLQGPAAVRPALLVRRHLEARQVAPRARRGPQRRRHWAIRPAARWARLELRVRRHWEARPVGPQELREQLRQEQVLRRGASRVQIEA